MSSYADIATKAAREAGKIHKKHFQTNLTTETKSASFDLVTEADLESEKKIISTVRRYFPDHNFLAEEGRYEKRDSEYTWIIDPLDGTNNFVYGLPIFCTSIALLKGPEVVLGVIYDVSRDELFRAEKGGGAFLNNKKLSVSAVDTLQRSMLVTGFYYDRGIEMVETLEWIKKFFFKRITGLRRLGAAALDLCYVACGRVTGFWEFVLSPWDFAAGKIIVEEAGGRITGRHGEDVDVKKNSFVVASNGKIHAAMLDVLK
jgi:myo-inositol-1(or 4)-monophosphatase